MLARFPLALGLALGLAGAAPGSAPERPPARPAKPPVDPLLYQALEWRSVGPFRGGPVASVAGFSARPRTFLIGALGGGIWRTEDGGTSWRNVSDAFLRTGRVTALAAASGDANVVYAATAEEGVYRSGDGGRTWAKAGLDQARPVGVLRVAPMSPATVYAAAIGAGPTGRERGLLRTDDGGRTWKLLLSVDEPGRVCDLAVAGASPPLLVAGVCDGPSSGLLRSADGGESWTRLTEGLPRGPFARIALAASPARSGRVYACLDAEGGGLFRSEDGGESWARIASLDAGGLVAHPDDADAVYALGTWLRESTDAGLTFRPLPAPEGEHHALWVNPWWPEILIDGSDAGPAVSENRGLAFAAPAGLALARTSSLFVDRSSPYRVYAGDRTGAFAVSSRGATVETLPPGSGPVAANPDDPSLVYVGGRSGQVLELDRRSGQVRDASERPGASSARRVHRFREEAPLLVSAHDPKVLFQGANVLLRSDDRGHSWTTISPDLTKGAPAAIACLAESAHEPGTIWAGTDDGTVTLTRNSGNTWSTVTPPGLVDAVVGTIEVSPHDPGSAWVAAMSRGRDSAPQLFKTADYGRTWTRLVAGLPEGGLRVVREDPVRRGLVYAGGASGVFVSFDNGQSWQAFRQNLGAVAVDDLKVRGEDLVAATDGRGLWILDDLSPLRQIGLEVAKADVFVFRPRRAVQVRGKAAPPGDPADAGRAAFVYYLLAKGAGAPVVLEVLDARGRVVRRETSEGGRLPARAGMNRWSWDLRAGPAGIPVTPGSYQVRLARGDRVSSQGFEVARDTGASGAEEELAAQPEMLGLLRDRIDEVHAATERLAEVRARARAAADRPEDAQAREAARALVDRIAAWERMAPEAGYVALALALSGADAPPTNGQRDRLAELDSDLARWRAELDDLLARAAALPRSPR